MTARKTLHARQTARSSRMWVCSLASHGVHTALHSVTVQMGAPPENGSICYNGETEQE